MRCPDCDERITAEAVNIQEGIALCPRCGELYRLSELSDSDRSLEEILTKPPGGCSLEDFGSVVTATASLRSIGSFLGCACFALFWNGLLSLFVLLAIAGLYTNLVGPLPAWFPLPGLKQGKPEMNGEPMGLRESLFLCLFLTPFLVVGIGITVAMFLSLLGKVEVVIDQTASHVATGVGMVKWKRRFDPLQVRAIKFGTSSWQSEGRPSKLIEIVADRTLKFGSGLPAERMEWLHALLKSRLLPVGKQRPVTTTPSWESPVRG